MATIERVIVTLRSELGSELSRAQNELLVLQESEPNRKNLKREKYVVGSVSRLQTAIHALGALQLGDIEREGEFVA